MPDIGGWSTKHITCATMGRIDEKSARLIGFFMLSTGITPYAISRLAERTNGKR